MDTAYRLRQVLRTSRIFPAVLEIIALKLPLPRSLKLAIATAYLKCDGVRPKKARVLREAIALFEEPERIERIRLARSGIIKPASKDEKGVLLVGFEHEINSLARSENARWVRERYDLLFMPTWQPLYSTEYLRALSVFGESLFVLPSSYRCYFEEVHLSEAHTALPFHASSWINHRQFTPVTNKDIDILMVANFARYKRHELLFAALPELPSDLNVVLVGRQLGGRGPTDLLAEARRFGVENRFTIIESPSDSEVRNYLARAKIVLGLSEREGSYVSLGEALIAGSCVAVYTDAVIGTKGYINPETGFLLQPSISLARQLLVCIERSKFMRPREWAIRNISSEHNISTLNRILRYEYEKRGRKWTRDITPFHIDAFEIKPTLANWPDNIIEELHTFAAKGIDIKVTK